MPGAAPWERAGNSESAPAAPDTWAPSVEQVEPPADEAAPDPGQDISTDGGGSHTAGTTVADLIARITGEHARPARTPGPKRTPTKPEASAKPEKSPGSAQTGTPSDPAKPTETSGSAVDSAARPRRPARRPAPVGEPATEVFPLLPAHADELPDLSALRAPLDLGPSAQRDTGEPDASPADGPPDRPRRRTAMVLGRVAAALLTVGTLALTGAAWQWQTSKDRSLNRVAALDLNSRDIIDPNAQFGDENFLMVGVDSRLGQNSDMGAGTTDDAAGARSDTIMLVNIPANRKRVVAVSFPRDLSITPMQCEHWDPGTGAYGPATDPDSPVYGMDKVYTETKLNSAYAVGGPKCLVKVIQKLSGLSVNRFMAVDFSGFAKMVDAVGGVEVCSTTPLEDYELGTVLPTAGRQIIDGHTALQYVRARQVTTESNGDYGRIKRQQLFLSSLLRTLISRDTFFSLNKLNNVVNMFISDSFVDNVGTKDLVDLGQSVQGIDAGRVTFVTIPTVGYADEYGNEVPRTDDVRALFDAIIDDDPLPEEHNAGSPPAVPENGQAGGDAAQKTAAEQNDAAVTPAPRPAATGGRGDVVDAVAASPGDVTVRVSNSTGEDGLAATAADQLERHGFKIVSPDDYPGKVDGTTVFFSPGNEKAAATVASSFSQPTIERVTGMGNVVRVVLGADFHAVGAPTPSGSAVRVRVVHDRSTSTESTHLPADLNVTNAADTTCE